MNYKESAKILEDIQKVNRVLINCHRSPDPDSIGSALALRRVLINMGKQVEVICPSKELFVNVSYLEDYKEIQKGVDFSKFDFSKYEIFMTLDSSSWDMVSGEKDVIPKGITTIMIDHHLTNKMYGDLNLIDNKVTSVGELLFLVFEDWGVEIDKETANCLMAGIVGDTGAFRYPGSNERTFEVVGKLMELGADKDMAIYGIYRNEPFELIKFYAEVLVRMKIDEKGKFVWSAIPFEVYKKLGKPATAKESSASLFAQVVKGTEFGFVALEEKKGKLTISFRSRTGFDTSQIALALGGGGHIYASGATVEGLSFDRAVNKVLGVARKYAKGN